MNTPRGQARGICNGNKHAVSQLDKPRIPSRLKAVALRGATRQLARKSMNLKICPKFQKRFSVSRQIYRNYLAISCYFATLKSGIPIANFRKLLFYPIQPQQNLSLKEPKI